MKQSINSVLLIDDDEATNFLNLSLIERANIAKSIQAVENGQLALDFLSNQGDFADPEKDFPQPDLIFLDINMPVLNGWEFLERYEQLPANQKCKVLIVMLTTTISAEQEEKMNQFTSVSGYLSKPLSAGALNDVITKHFSGDS